MNFIEAFKELQKGKKVKLKTWNTCYLELENGDTLVGGDTVTKQRYTGKEISNYWITKYSIDGVWEVFEDPNKKKARDLREKAEKMVKEAEQLERSL